MTWTHIKHLLLALLITLSLFLSVGLWSAGGHLGEQTTSMNNRTPASLVDRTNAEVFAPYQIVLHGSEEADLLLTSIDQVREMMDDSLEEMVFNEVTSTEQVSRENYQETLSSGTWIEFVYDDRIPLGLLEERFENLPSDIASQSYNRLAVNLEELEELHFYDSVNQTFHHVEADEVQLETVNIFLNTDDISYVEAEAVAVHQNIVYLPIENVEVAYRDYVVERLPNMLYVNEFFTDTSEVDEMRTASDIRYIDLTTEVRINQNYHTVTYLRQRPDLGEMTVTERFNQSFDQLQRVENWIETVQFHSYDEESNRMLFQRYIDGLPVFSLQQQEAITEISVVESGLTHLRVPLRVVQTPLTLVGPQEKEMLSSSEILSRLNSVNEGLHEEIDDIRMGLTWRESEENSQIIHFEPNWYVSLDGSWQELERFIEMQEGIFDGL